MTDLPRTQITADKLDNVTWRKSSFSNDQGQCVEVAALNDGRIAVRNSNHPQASTVLFTRAEIAAWIKGCQAGEFDDLAQA
ncbi:DUF397 domain-containing protein [Haloechinothrix sp. YIM 98757]|uniref:DUF397 domain-containing protein n=1 Tax=Haloechinothrix aidingensis TaxID=2752311 RepID=A0A838A5S3_9PSEU|nr:DUF397 domain-containing protein [Haloechinothrix aidingensis]MBA0124378.1 DUF397 domain-containing protein [Haloechinothrix aidingensis]